jgi:hypothetical protein
MDLLTQAIENTDVVPLLNKLIGRVRTDETGSSSDQDSFPCHFLVAPFSCVLPGLHTCI